MTTLKRSRREFLRHSVQAVTGAGLTIGFPTIVPGLALGAPGVAPAGERIRIGHIGVGNQGRNNLKALMQHTVAVCDVDKKRLAEAKESVEKATGWTCAANVNFKGPPPPDTEPPAELDYDFWLGPAPQRPYNPKRVHYDFRFFWDYSGGQLTNWGAHHLDIAQWGLGTDGSGPVSISGQARFHQQGWYEVPEWCEVQYQYPGNIRVIAGQGLRDGTMFLGDGGTIFVARNKLESNPPEIIKQALTEKDVHLYVSKNHHANWLECIKTRALPICDVAIGHRSATVCHLGNIAIRSKCKITWDPVKEDIVGDAEAGKMLSREYRSPWRLPH